MPEGFWGLTPREFALIHAGFQRREARAWERVATLGLWVLAPYTKKKMTPAQLLGRHRLDTQPPRHQVESSAEDDEIAIEIERARVLAQALAWAEGD